jgi:gamma-glutamyl-gamma-aminobutyrate hydrolase PuuD
VDLAGRLRYSFPRYMHVVMTETQDQWYNRQAVEQLAQHIPFERDSASKAEQIEMLRGLVIRYGRDMDPELFGFEARNELIRLGLWSRIGVGHG